MSKSATAICIACGDKAVSWCGHLLDIKTMKPYLAGWCEKHSDGGLDKITRAKGFLGFFTPYHKTEEQEDV